MEKKRFNFKFTSMLKWNRSKEKVKLKEIIYPNQQKHELK
jgi:hypothetical protein